jgi:sigma-E factor negative regulatory protein RseA
LKLELEMPNSSQPDHVREEILSALVDGELDASGTQAACELWHKDEQARIQWADYQLIGDVLRSDDLARSGAHESALFARIQAELALQPVVLAPRPLPENQSPDKDAVHAAMRNSRRAWWSASAVAAGFIAVAGAWSVMRVSLPVDSEPLVAQSEVAPLSASASSVASSEANSGADTLVRDAELDRYLMAHKQFSSASVLGAASGSLRQVVLESSGR